MLLVDQGKEELIAAEAILRVQARQAARNRPPLPFLDWLRDARPAVHGLPYGKGGLPACLRDIYADTSREIAVVKAAQVGVSEWLVSQALWCADTRQGGRGNALYIFPAISQVYDFVRARVDTAVEESEYLYSRVHPRRGLVPVGKLSDNVGLKRVADGFVYFRGSNAEAGLLAIDADVVVYDEVDRLREGTLDKGAKRLGSSTLGWQRFVGTPTYPDQGIDSLWLRSDRRRWHITCACGERQTLAFPDNVREDGQTICRACHSPIDRLAEGKWLPENPGAEMHGYHVTKLTSPRADMTALAKLGYAILRKEVVDPSAVQQFYNQDLGEAHLPEGGDAMIVPLPLAIAAEQAEHPPIGPEVLACDVARRGHDKTIIVWRQGRVARIVWRVQGHDTMQTAGTLAELHAQRKHAHIVVDGVGVGAGVIDRLRELGIGVIEVQGGAGASDSSRFVNRITELWWRMRTAYEEGLDVEVDAALRSQVSGRRYRIQSDRRISMESKEDMHAAGRQSPDEADALALSFAVEWDVSGRERLSASSDTLDDETAMPREMRLGTAQDARESLLPLGVARGSDVGPWAPSRWGKIGAGHRRS